MITLFTLVFNVRKVTGLLIVSWDAFYIFYKAASIDVLDSLLSLAHLSHEIISC